jgi:hypothetical protein
VVPGLTPFPGVHTPGYRMSPRSGAGDMSGRRIEVSRGSHPGLRDVAPFRGSGDGRVAGLGFPRFPGFTPPGYVMSPRIGARGMDGGRDRCSRGWHPGLRDVASFRGWEWCSFEAISPRSEAHISALCPTIGRIVSRSIRAAEFFPISGNWFDHFVDRFR